MESDGFPHLRLRFFNGCSGGNATRQIGGIRRVIALGLLDDDRVAHMTSLLQSGLLQNAVYRARRQVIAGLARHSHSAPPLFPSAGDGSLPPTKSPRAARAGRAKLLQDRGAQ